MRVLYGIERVPATMPADDPRLPSLELGTEPLRLNTVPIPRDAWGADVASHAGRMAAVEAWLLAQCGDYNKALRRAVSQTLVMMQNALDLPAITAEFARFDGLYQPQDRFWSNLRPLPRAWFQRDGVWQRADLAMWDGATLHALDIHNLSLPTICPDSLLPMSPFRR
jgi:hypothetical protein